MQGKKTTDVQKDFRKYDEKDIPCPLSLGPFDFDWLTFRVKEENFRQRLLPGLRKKLETIIKPEPTRTIDSPSLKDYVPCSLRHFKKLSRNIESGLFFVNSPNGRKNALCYLLFDFSDWIPNRIWELNFVLEFSERVLMLLRSDLEFLDIPLIGYSVALQSKLENWDFVDTVRDLLKPKHSGKSYERHLPNPISSAYFVLIENHIRHGQNRFRKNAEDAFKWIKKNKAMPAGHELERSAALSYHNGEKRVLTVSLSDKEIEALIIETLHRNSSKK